MNTQFMEGYRIGLAEMREKCAKVCEEIEQDRWNLYKGRPPYTGSESGRADPHEQGVSMGAGECVAAIRAIKFEGDTGFRPVSEMIAEHKQDPKKAAAIEKAKMRKAEQAPVAIYGFCPICGRKGVSRERGLNGNDTCVTGHRYASSEAIPDAPQPVKQEPVAWQFFEDGKWWIGSEYNHHRQLTEEAGYPIRELYATPVQQAAKKSVERHVENVYERGDKYFAWIGDNYVQIYTAPVRTKDLTDAEVEAIMVEQGDLRTTAFARAVIAKFKEKNK